MNEKVFVNTDILLAIYIKRPDFIWGTQWHIFFLHVEEENWKKEFMESKVTKVLCILYSLCF